MSIKARSQKWAKKYTVTAKPAPKAEPVYDAINPRHYRVHPSGVECIAITRHMSFNIGNAVKYLWRADEKGVPIEDLKKAIWYIQDEINKRSGE